LQIFVAGGTGVVGRRVVPALLREGHEVSVVARSAEKVAAVGALGAIPIEVGLFDAEALRAAVAGQDVVVNLATSIPPFSKAAMKGAWKMNDRIRREGSKNLVDAALAAGASRYLQESVTFSYIDAGSQWIAEDHPTKANSITASSLDAEGEARRFGASGASAVILRFGSFYGPDSGHTAAVVKFARRGFGTTPGPRHAYLSSISTDDAAAAVVAAAAEAATGTYNVVDDNPVTRDEFDKVLARAVGRERLRPLPNIVERLMGDKLDHVVRSQRVSNKVLRTATRWQPRYPSVREGIPAIVATMTAGAMSPPGPSASSA